MTDPNTAVTASTDVVNDEHTAQSGMTDTEIAGELLDDLGDVLL